MRVRSTASRPPAVPRVFYPVLLVLLIWGCANIQPPPGGPKDETPPSVVLSLPKSDSVGVAPDSKIVLYFSEKLKEPQDLRSKVRFYPAVEIEQAKARGDRVEIKIAGTLHPDTTYVVALLPGVQDRHNVLTRSRWETVFATSTAIASGEIQGEVWFKDEPSGDAVLWLYHLPDSIFDPTAQRPAREARSNPSGEFKIPYLPTDGAAFLLFAFRDTRGDGQYNPEDDFAVLYPDTLRLSESLPVAALQRMTIIDPNEPGSLMGKISTELVLERDILLRLVPATEKPLLVRTDSTLAYEFRAVPPGTYALWAFLDYQPDSICGLYTDPEDSSKVLEEPCQVFPDSITIFPGEKTELPEMIFPGVIEAGRKMLLRPPGSEPSAPIPGERDGERRRR